jgi:hypothetical protein
LKLKNAVAALLFMSFLSSSGIAHATTEQSSAYRKFVIYYGWYSDAEGRLGPDIDRIIRSKPEYVVSPYFTSTGLVNLSPQVTAKFRDSGIGILVYIATGNAGRSLDSVFSEIKTGIEAGANGVMLDEVAMLHQNWQVDHYEKIYDYVKSFGTDKIVVANPGSILVSESVMSVSDIVCFEHQWRLAPALDWFSKYPPERFMGISSNDIAGVMGYSVDGDLATRDTVEAWQSGVGYHYATDAYTRLPSWFEGYQEELGDFVISGAKLGELFVKTIDTEGNEIEGLWIEARKDGRTVATGFSPANFMLPEGGYQLFASDYQNFVFSKWQDGGSLPQHSVTASESEPVETTAVYQNDQMELHIQSFDLSGKEIKGVNVSVFQDGVSVAEGKTPLQLKLPIGTYTISASSSKYYKFDHWSDGSTANATTITMRQDTKVLAYFGSAVDSKLGSLDCDADFKGDVAESMLRDGVFGAMLELHMRKSLSGMAC